MSVSNLTFDYPFILTAYLIYIPVIVFDILNMRKKGVLPSELGKKTRASTFLFRLFIAFAIIALAGPRWGTGFAATEYRRGLDAVFAIDVSRSMDIQDAQGGINDTQSRLERGLSIARETAAAVSGVRFAAAIGRGRGYLTVPLTWENEAVLSFLDALDTASMTGRSTNLEALVDAAAEAFQSSSAAQKIIVLISDGESHTGVLGNALGRCVREGIIVITVALGSDMGRPVPVSPSLTDFDVRQMSPVISRRNTVVMRNAAERTGGIYIDGSRNDAAGILSFHLLSIAQETEQGFLGSSRRETKERRSLFIILAIIAYGFSKFIPLKSRFILASTIIIVFTSCSESKLLLLEANYLNSRGRYDEAIIPYLKALHYEDAAPYAEYGLGLTFYSLDEGRAALKRYSSSQSMLERLPAGEHHELRYRVNYNSGIIFFDEGDFHSAAASFRNALRADPGRIDAKRNLELSLISIAAEAGREDRLEVQSNVTRDVLFGYLRQQEWQQWRSAEWTVEDDFLGPDY